MLKSMTGYGRGEIIVDNYKLVIEAKSVNNRFLEVVVRLPRQLYSLENEIKKRVQAVFARGKIDVFISFDQVFNKRPPISIDKDLAIAYYNLLSGLSEELDLSDRIDAATLAKFPGVVSQEKEEDVLEVLGAHVFPALEEALRGLLEMRIAEGAELLTDFRQRLARIDSLRESVSVFAPQIAAEYRDKLRIRIAALLEGQEVDEARITNEAAFFADKADICEELTRLSSHLSQFTAALESDEPVGRKLDFIVQEINREVNTVGSKANSLEITALVIDAKSELEKIREQVQNIE